MSNRPGGIPQLVLVISPDGRIEEARSRLGLDPTGQASVALGQAEPSIIAAARALRGGDRGVGSVAELEITTALGGECARMDGVLELGADGMVLAVFRGERSERESSEQLGAVLRRLAHDMSTPLTSAMLILDLVAEEDLSATERVSLVGGIKLQVGRLTELIDELRRLGRARCPGDE